MRKESRPPPFFWKQTKETFLTDVFSNVICCAVVDFGVMQHSVCLSSASGTKVLLLGGF